jgi:hypothetical protein
VRARREPQNPGITKDPPNPPGGGSSDGSISIEENYVTDRGRRRQRTLTVSLAEARSQLVFPTLSDDSDWRHIRGELKRAAGDSAFEIWLSGVELVACDHDGALVLACAAETRRWVRARFGLVLDRIGGRLDREARFASDRELQLLQAIDATSADVFTDPISPDHQEAV